MQKNQLPPLTLYIHIPWCRKKCPYCDFNSCATTVTDKLEKQYIAALCSDLTKEKQRLGQNIRPLTSIYIGGGTPSLVSSASLAKLFDYITTHFQLISDCEISMEANPQTIDLKKCHELKKLGINRLSVGVQSFNDAKLRSLGRIHNSKQAITTVDNIRKAGFTNFNIDLMYGLPNQSVIEAKQDIQTAIKLNPPHISWYQLTLEPGTAFTNNPPSLPKEAAIIEMEKECRDILQQANFDRYEISAYAKPDHQCQHNLNYWQFGDYIGIGAGAHGKLSEVDLATGKTHVNRYAKIANYIDYIKKVKTGLFCATNDQVKQNSLAFEFMLNALRLTAPIPIALFAQRTGLSLSEISKPLQQAAADNLLTYDNKYITVTKRGHTFLNDLLALFLD